MRMFELFEIESSDNIVWSTIVAILAVVWGT